jgi:hypothetical protein
MWHNKRAAATVHLPPAGIRRLSSSRKFSNMVTCTERPSPAATSGIVNTAKFLPSGARSRFEVPA